MQNKGVEEEKSFGLVQLAGIFTLVASLGYLLLGPSLIEPETLNGILSWFVSGPVDNIVASVAGIIGALMAMPGDKRDEFLESAHKIALAIPLLGWALSLGGLVLTFTPLPLGIPMMMLGLACLGVESLSWLRKKSDTVDNLLFKFEEWDKTSNFIKKHLMQSRREDRDYGAAARNEAAEGPHESVPA